MFTFALATGQTEHCNCPQGLQKTSAAARNDGAIAQLVEQRTENPCVGGSIPPGTTSKTAACSNAGGCFVLVMMPKVVGDILAQMTRIVRFWSFAFLDNTIIAIQEKIPLYKILKMLFREPAMDS